MELNRMIIYTKDIQRITGKSDRYARKIMSRVRKQLGKEKHHLLSLGEFCKYMNLDEAEVARYLSE